ncbi:unnamed protein product [Ectocarpus sp. 12 AP-2014]
MIGAFQQQQESVLGSCWCCSHIAYLQSSAVNDQAFYNVSSVKYIFSDARVPTFFLDCLSLRLRSVVCSDQGSTGFSLLDRMDLVQYFALLTQGCLQFEVCFPLNEGAWMVTPNEVSSKS